MRAVEESSGQAGEPNLRRKDTSKQRCCLRRGQLQLFRLRIEPQYRENSSPPFGNHFIEAKPKSGHADYRIDP